MKKSSPIERGCRPGEQGVTKNQEEKMTETSFVLIRILGDRGEGNGGGKGKKDKILN